MRCGGTPFWQDRSSALIEVATSLHKSVVVSIANKVWVLKKKISALLQTVSEHWRSTAWPQMRRTIRQRPACSTSSCCWRSCTKGILHDFCCNHLLLQLMLLLLE